MTTALTALRRRARVVFELADEIAHHHSEIAADLDARLARYANVNPSLLKALGGDQFPPTMWAFGGRL